MRAIALLLALLVVPTASAMVFRPSDVPTPPEPAIPASAPAVEEAAEDAGGPDASKRDETRDDPGAPPPASGPAAQAPAAPAAQPPAASPGEAPGAPTPPGPPASARETRSVEEAWREHEARSPPECLGLTCSRGHIPAGLVDQLPNKEQVELFRAGQDALRSGAAADVPARRLPEAPSYGAPPFLAEPRLAVWPSSSLAPVPPLAIIAEPEGIETTDAVDARPIERPEPATFTLPRIVAASAVGALLIALLYSRIARRDEALRSDRRIRILELLAERGPMALPDLTREMGCDRTTVTHHLRLLSRLSHVVVERVDGRVVAALPGQQLGEALAPRAPDVIERLLREHGGQMTRAELHEAAADLPLRTRNHALARLASSGRIMRVLRAGTEIVLLTPPESGPGVTAA